MTFPRIGVGLLLALGASFPTAQAQTHLGGPGLSAFRVLSVTPSINALNVSRSTAVQVTFTQAVDLSSLTERSFHVFGRWSGITEGTFSFGPSRRHVVFTPLQPFSPGETVYVTLSHSVRDHHGNTLPRGYAWAFWVDSRASSNAFSLDQTLIPGATPYGAYGGDLNADGLLDLAIPNENSSDVSVFMNQGGNFGGQTSYPVGFHCSPSEGADFDFDGKVDLAVANILDDDVSILLGRGDGSFDPQVRYNANRQPRGLTLLDADSDGDIDMVTANRRGGNLSLFLGRGDGTFDPQIGFQGGVSNETGVVACDMNNDFFFDLVIVGYGSNEASVMLGDGQGNFTLHDTRTIGSDPWMVVWGDVDGDGDNDVAAILSGGSAAAICRNDGTGNLGPPTTYSAGSFPIAIDLGDLNGDGALDLATSSFSSSRFTFYYNDGAGNFGNSFTLPATSTGSCTVLHDVDADGDVDITGIDEIADLVFIFKQDG